MIVLDDQEQGSSKLAVPSATLRLPEPVAGRSASPLPDYETSQAQQTSAQVSAQPPVHSHPVFRKPSLPNHFNSRFWRVTFFALAIYVFLSVVIGIPVIVTRVAYRKSRSPPPDIQSLFLLENNEAAAPLASPGSGMLMTTSNASICDDWDTMDTVNGQYISTARHTLPPNGLFSVRSNATDEVIPRPGGMHNLTVDFNDDKSEKNVVLTVSLTTSSIQLRNDAHICFSSVGQGRGLSVYMPQALEMSDVLAFDVRLLFPRTHLVNSIDLVTYLPMFHQSFGYLAPKVPFEIINIAGAGVAIICDHLQASKIAVKNSYAPISGSFNVTQSLTLDNIAGSITTNTTLTNDPTTQLPTYLVVDTGNDDIFANVTMAGSVPRQCPKFNVNVRTFNGSLGLNVGHAPATLPAALNLQVDNNQALSQVQLDSKFTGFIDLHTKLAPVSLDYDQIITTDPTGASRKWQLDVDLNSTSSTRGWVGWGTRPAYWDPMNGGKVTVGSSLSAISLQLGP